MGFLRHALKNILLSTPAAPFLCHRFQYNFSPAQLGFLCDCLDRTATLPGPILEIGCFAGCTTVWLNKHMDASQIEKPYVAIDTFSGFTEADIEYEVQERSKSEVQMRAGFASNSQDWFNKTMSVNQVSRVTSIRGDAAELDYKPFRNISFALIDVDLYLPVKKTLESIWPLMAPGGIVVVDDCVDGQCYDGALQAYSEFTEGRQLPRRIVHTKLGVIEVASP
jgi:O-methyltransferase